MHVSNSVLLKQARLPDMSTNEDGGDHVDSKIERRMLCVIIGISEMSVVEKIVEITKQSKIFRTGNLITTNRGNGLPNSISENWSDCLSDQ